jgi:hypothetical protein
VSPSRIPRSPGISCRARGAVRRTRWRCVFAPTAAQQLPGLPVSRIIAPVVHMTTIRIDRDWRAHAAENRRYFPEWADRPPRRRTQLEAEHNSYSAGGYAEEFGYCVQPDSPSAAATLVGDSEGCWYWRVQVGALHPGYPECPKPLDRDSARSRADASADSRSVRSDTQTSRLAGNHFHGPLQGRLMADFKSVRVRDPKRAPTDSTGVGARLVLLWKEFRILRREFGVFRR